jgi:hypothetical protein
MKSKVISWALYITIMGASALLDYHDHFIDAVILAAIGAAVAIFNQLCFNKDAWVGLTIMVVGIHLYLMGLNINTAYKHIKLDREIEGLKKESVRLDNIIKQNKEIRKAREIGGAQL